MPVEVRTASSLEELRQGISAISHYFGFRNEPEDAERFAQWLETERMHVAWENGGAIGGAGAFTFSTSVPGGASVAAAGVSVVGVLPTHRRRGVLTALMREQLADCRARGEAFAYLWASEGTIYGRFGYGLASRCGAIELPKERTRFALPFETRGQVRLVEADEAAAAFPPLYEQVRAQRAGMFARSATWWETRRLADRPGMRPAGAPLNRALLSYDGEPAGYATYRVAQDWASGSSTGTVSIQEVVTPTPEAARELWRWLLDFDWTSKFAADLLPTRPPALSAPRRAAPDAVPRQRRRLGAAARRRSGARRARLPVG